MDTKIQLDDRGDLEFVLGKLEEYCREKMSEFDADQFKVLTNLAISKMVPNIQINGLDYDLSLSGECMDEELYRNVISAMNKHEELQHELIEIRKTYPEQIRAQFGQWVKQDQVLEPPIQSSELNTPKIDLNMLKDLLVAVKNTDLSGVSAKLSRATELASSVPRDSDKRAIENEMSKILSRLGKG